jgi:putative membrane protein
MEALQELLAGLRYGLWMVPPMERLMVAVAVVVALQHVAFFVLESFLWEKPIGMKVFRLTPERARITAPLAANQGVYNAFLAAGLFWGVATAVGGGLGYAEFARMLIGFFLGCVAVAGIVGAMTVNRRILWVQAMPAILGLALLLATRSG